MKRLKTDVRNNFFFHLNPILFCIAYRYGMNVIAAIVNALKVAEPVVIWSIIALYYIFFLIFFCWYLGNITGAGYFKRWKVDIKSGLLFLALLAFSLFWIKWFAAVDPIAITKKPNEWTYIHYNIPQYIQVLQVIIHILVQVTETLLYQGIMMETFFKNSKYGLDILVCASLFSMYHLQFPWSFVSFIAYFLIGVSLPIIYKKTGSIYCTICLHLLINYLNIATGLLLQ